MKKTLAGIAALALGVGMFVTSNVSAAGTPTCLVKNGTIEYDSLNQAVEEAKAGDTLKVYPGQCNVYRNDVDVVEGQTGWYLPITKSINIVGVNAKGKAITDPTKTEATIYSSYYVANGAWASQNLITVFADNVKISGLTIMDKVDGNKTIEVVDGVKNFQAVNNTFAPLSVDYLTEQDVADAGYTSLDEYAKSSSKYGAALYLSGNVVNAVVKNNYFQNSGLTFDHPYEASVKVKENTFSGVKTWGPNDEYVYSTVGISNWSTTQDNNDYSKFDLVFTDNNLIDCGKINLAKATAGVFDLSKNYWGSATPTFGNISYDDTKVVVSTEPYYVDLEHTKTAPYSANIQNGIVLKSFEIKQISSEDQALIDALIPENGQVYSNLDISVIVKATGQKKHELSKAILFTFDIPSNLPAVNAGYARSYFVIRLHEGEAEKLDIVTNEETIAFDSNLFSTYTFGYVDTMIPADRTDLQAAINKAESIDRSLYTKESLAQLDEALENAKKYDDGNLSILAQEAVDESTVVLEAAIAALELLPVTPATGALTEISNATKQLAHLAIVSPAYLGLTVLALASVLLGGWYHYAKKYAELKK